MLLALVYETLMNWEFVIVRFCLSVCLFVLFCSLRIMPITVWSHPWHKCKWFQIIISGKKKVSLVLLWICFRIFLSCFMFLIVVGYVCRNNEIHVNIHHEEQNFYYLDGVKFQTHSDLMTTYQVNV
jgi:hypothetical protein